MIYHSKQSPLLWNLDDNKPMNTCLEWAVWLDIRQYNRTYVVYRCPHGSAHTNHPLCTQKQKGMSGCNRHLLQTNKRLGPRDNSLRQNRGWNLLKRSNTCSSPRSKNSYYIEYNSNSQRDKYCTQCLTKRNIAHTSISQESTAEMENSHY